jgi:hypothetical protein
MRNYFIKKYIVDFRKRKIYLHICGFLRFPIVRFEQVGGIEKVWGDEDKKSFFYKAWKKGKRYEHGIPLSDLHGVTGPFDSNFARNVMPMLLKVFSNNDNTDISDSQTVDDNVFHIIDGKIYYKRNFRKDLLTAFVVDLLLSFALAGPVIRSRGVILLVLLCLFYSSWKSLTKDNFYIMKTENNIFFNLFKDNINCSISEIKSISITSSFDYVTSISIFLELYNGKRHHLQYFAGGYVSEVYPFLRDLKSIIGDQIEFKLVDFQLKRIIFNNFD